MHHFTRPEIATLERLRARFLSPDTRAGDYWRSEEDLALYDSTFGERIGWKWDGVLSELISRGWQPRSRRLVDWGCGSGVASRRVLEAWPGHFTSLAVVDRSPLAMRYVCSRAGQTPISTDAGFIGATVVLSHVLNELSPEELKRLVRALASAEEVIWVEAGAHEESRRLVTEAREPLLAGGEFYPVAPCTHARTCGLLTARNERHWCHSFGRAPSEAFQDARWAEFSSALGIDLRSLPYSFLTLARAGTPGPAGASRVLGHPREYKGFAKVLSCHAVGVGELMIQKRDAPELYRRLREGERPPVYGWQLKGERIVGADT